MSAGAGWNGLVSEVETEAKKLGIKLTTIKEKFGLLRIYADRYDERLEQIISKAEATSATICEKCGKPGTQTTDNRWILTLCPECMKELGRK